MKIEGEHDIEKWKKKRTRTFISFCVLACCLGTEYSIIIPSLWFYISDVIKEKRAVTFYGLTLAVYYMSAITGSFLVTWLVDRTRRVRWTMLVLTMCEVVGNILYSVPVSAYFPLMGRFIQGLGDINMSLITAEIGRSFPPDQIGSKISTIVTCFSITFVTAPAANVLFKYIDFNFFGWQVNYGNLPSVVMVIFFVIVFFIVFFGVSDISREYDLKENSAHLSDERDVCDTEHTPLLRSEQPIAYTNTGLDTNNIDENRTPRVKHLLYSFDFLFLVSLGFLMSFSVVSFLDVAMPIYGKQFYNFSSRDTGILFFVNGVLFIIVVNVTKMIRGISEYLYLFIGLTLFTTSTVLLLAVTIIRGSSYYLGVSLFCGYVLLLGVCWCVEQVFIRSLLTKIVPSSHQAFGEGIRRSASSLACIVATLSVPYILEQLCYLCVVVLVVTGCAMATLYSRSSLREPCVI